MLSGRTTEVHNSFRELSQFTEASEALISLPLQKEPVVNKSIEKSARGMSEGRARQLNKENAVTRHTESSRKKTPVVNKKNQPGLGNSQTKENIQKKVRQLSTENIRDLSSMANPQSLRKVLEEVDNNYAQKFLNKGPIMSTRDRKILGEPEHLMKVQEFTSSNNRRDSGPFEIDMSIKARSQLGTEVKSGASKPPLKSSTNSTVSKHHNILLQNQTNYESFNPRYHEKQPHVTEPEDASYSIPKIQEFEPHTKPKSKLQTTPDQSFSEERNQNESYAKLTPQAMDMGELRAQNRQAWKQEKSVLDSMIKRRMSQGYFEEAVEETKDASDTMSDNRRASMISQTSSVENNNMKSFRNKNMMDILNKLENKMFENKGRVSDISSSISILKSESKTSLRSKNSIDSRNDDGKSILDIMQDHMRKDTRTSDQADIPNDENKEFYINLQELVGESKKAPIHSNVRKASQPQVFSMSIAEHVQPINIAKRDRTPLGTNTTATPTKEVKNISMSKEGSHVKSIDKRMYLQESGISRSMLAAKARQSSSKSPANSRSGRAMKTESFEVVMARLKKKTPGNTPTKNNPKRNMVY